MGIKKGLFKLSLIMLALLFITGGILPSLGVAAADVVKIEKTYDIAIAYDNSGSMYMNTSAWSHAKFAMEIFASMLDYGNGDKLTIFPMWEVVTDGSAPTKEEMPRALSTKPVEVKSLSDLEKIHNMYVAEPGDTPISVVDRAAEYLKKSSATERWLIVLTDGIFKNDKGAKPDDDMEPQDTRNYLLKYTGDINVQYVRLGELLKGEEKISGDPSRNFYTEYAATSDQLQDKLIGICNKIFQRDELVGKLSGNTLKLDISMKSLIVFVQGQGAAINSLADKKGNYISPLSDSGQRKYSELSCHIPGYGVNPTSGVKYAVTPTEPDRTLYGQVVTFGACSVGAYTLDIVGADADKIKIFYEPDVDMQVDVYDKDGNVVDVQKASIIAGDYIVKAKLVDAKTGADITKSPLMGDNVKFDLKITYDGKDAQTYPIDLNQGSTVSLVPGEKINTVVTGTYLEDYKISNEDDPSIFPGNIVVIDPEEGLQLKAEVLQENNWYQLSKNKEWKPVKVKFVLDNEPLTDEQLKALVFDIKPESGAKNKNGDSLKCRIEYLEGESAIEIHLAEDKNGKYVAPKVGKYKMTVTATTVANTGLTLTASDKVSFDIQLLPLAVLWAIGISAALLLLLLLLLFLNQKVLPRDIEHVSTTFMREGDTVDGLRASVKYSKKGKKGKLIIATPATVPMDSACRATLRLEALDKRLVKSKNRRVRITDISSQNNAVVINNYTYEKSPVNGKMIDPLQPEMPGGETRPIRKDGKIVFVEIQSQTATLICKVQNR